MPINNFFQKLIACLLILKRIVSFCLNIKIITLVLYANYYITGNLCRCTGYRPILEGLMTLTTCDKSSDECSMGNKICCMRTTECNAEKLSNYSDFLPYDPSQEPIFPPELIVR